MTPKRTAHRAVIYVRISKDRTEETSTTTQEAICREYAERHGWEFVGRSRPRPIGIQTGFEGAGLDRAMRLLRTGAADVLVVWRLDRFVRSVAHFGKLWPELDAAKASFASVTEGFDTTTAMGNRCPDRRGVRRAGVRDQE